MLRREVPSKLCKLFRLSVMRKPVKSEEKKIVIFFDVGLFFFARAAAAKISPAPAAVDHSRLRGEVLKSLLAACGQLPPAEEGG
jgi:hypothetical protein